MPFDRTADEAAAAELAAAAKAEAAAQMWRWIRNGGIAAGRARRAAAGLGPRPAPRPAARGGHDVRRRAAAHGRRRAGRCSPRPPPRARAAPALAALERADAATSDELRDELAALVERQPEDVAALLRGWLVDRR